MWTRADLKLQGKRAFQNNYGNAVAVALIMGVFSSGVSGGIQYRINYSGQNPGYHNGYDVWHSGFGMVSSTIATIFALFALAFSLGMWALKIFVGNVLIVGGQGFFIQNRIQGCGMGKMLDGFKSGHYGNVVLTMFLRDLFTTLWGMLLVVPGIIKHYEYLMVPYILAENPGMDRREAFQISRQMMNGEKWNAFVLDLSFLGWIILSTFTCGILAVLFVAPYINATFAELYIVNKDKAFREGYIR